MAPSGKKVQAMFGEIAPQYDLLNRILSFGVDRSWRKRTVRKINLQPGERLLDLCCGTGDLALEFAAPEVAVVGSDFAFPMLPLAQRKANGKQQSIAWLQADAQHLPFPDASFDALTIAFGIRNVEDPRRGLQECARVLRPGGRLGILEFFPIKSHLWGRLFGFYFRYVLPQLAKLTQVGRKVSYAYLPNSVEDFVEVEGFQDWTREAGFTEVQNRALTGGIARLVYAVRSQQSAESKP